MNRRAAILGALAVLVALVFAQVAGFDFVFDDRDYVALRPHVLAGVTADGISWAFTTLDAAFWHPLTWISLMLDSSLFGSGPAGFHVTAAIIHLASTLLLFLVLEGMTGATWRSAAVAAFFAVHPLHVESVAWVAERKDLLSGFFWIASMGAYLRLVRHPGIRSYLVLIACYLMGLMAKPMIVTLPFALLLLDLWPLRRVVPGEGDWIRRTGRLAVEKIPLLLPVPVIAWISYAAQAKTGAVSAELSYPLAIRVGNALASYGAYLGKTFWPAGLSAFYPHPGYGISLPAVAASTLLLVAVSVLAVWQIRRRPWLFTGWFWYLGTLVPVIGLVQIGRMGMADRFTYLPLIGIFVIVAWGVPELCERFRAPRWAAAVIGAMALAVWAPLAWVQVGYWRDDVTLFSHALAVTENNLLAQFNLGEALERRGDGAEAERHYREAIAIDPRFVPALSNLGSLLAQRGALLEAVNRYREALEIDPADAMIRYNLAYTLSEAGDQAGAEEQIEQAIRLAPSSAAYNNLGVILSRRGETARAREAFTVALRLDPGNESARANLAGLPGGGE